MRLSQIYLRICLAKLNQNQKHSRCKKEWPSTKKGLIELMHNQNGQSWPPAFDRFKSFGHNDLTFRYSRPPDVDGIKIFNKDDHASKHCSINLTALRPGHLHQKF